MQLLSVNIGKIRPLPNGEFSGIDKRPQADAVQIGTLGLAGDQIEDPRHHGGPDQAVYLYGQPDYDWFAQEDGMDVQPGLFGENLTIAGLESQTVLIGDRFEIGDVVLEATSPRIPCEKFAARIGDRKWVKRFFQANRPGVYCRVITEGQVRAGDALRHVPFAGEAIPVIELMTDTKNPSRERMEWLLKAPLHFKERAQYEAALARLG